MIWENGAKRQVVQKSNKGSPNNNLFNLKNKGFPQGQRKLSALSRGGRKAGLTVNK